MKGFILVAHGSRRAVANQEIANFTARVSQGMTGRFGVMGHAF